jgi:hypothetical protein
MLQDCLLQFTAVQKKQHHGMRRLYLIHTVKRDDHNKTADKDRRRAEL